MDTLSQNGDLKADPRFTCVLCAGAEVELADGQKLTAKMVILADGVHSKSAQKYHKVPLKVMDVAGWRWAH